MKRTKLLRPLKAHDCVFHRQGSDHSVYRRTGTRLQSAVPRHNEIKAGLVRKICKDLDIPVPDQK